MRCRRRRLWNLPPSEQLEQRLLLTVKVKFNPNSGLLKITGDKDANNVTLDGLANPGSLEVFINNALHDTYSGVKSLKINLKDGNDKLNMAFLDLAGNVNLKFGDGADVLDIGSFTALGSAGNGPSHFGGFFKAEFGNDEGDFVEMTNGVDIHGDVTINGASDARLTGDGTTPQGELGLDLYFRSDFTINLADFGDVDNDGRNLYAINLYVQGQTLIDASENVDHFMMLMNRFDGNFTAFMDDGDDDLFINFSGNQKNEFGAGAFFNGGDDNDIFTLGSGNLFSGSPPVITNFETIV